MEQHDLTLNETIIEEFLGVLRGHVRHQARPLDDLLQGNTFAARHLNCWHGTLTHTVNDTVEGRLQVDLGSVCFILLAQITAKKRK